MIVTQYSTPSGRRPVLEFIEKLPFETKYEVLVLLRRIENGEILTMPHSRSLSSMRHGLFELRIKDPEGIIRVFYYTKIHDSIFLLHALRKKSQTIPNKDKALILKRINEITKQHKG